jgi:hypothetical protein
VTWARQQHPTRSRRITWDCCRHASFLDRLLSGRSANNTLPGRVVCPATFWRCARQETSSSDKAPASPVLPPTCTGPFLQQPGLGSLVFSNSDETRGASGCFQASHTALAFLAWQALSAGRGCAGFPPRTSLQPRKRTGGGPCGNWGPNLTLVTRQMFPHRPQTRTSR